MEEQVWHVVEGADDGVDIDIGARIAMSRATTGLCCYLLDMLVDRSCIGRLNGTDVVVDIQF